MARIRSIKPDFFTSEDVVALSPLARLLFIALWCEADREGRMEWRPGTIKLRYFPGDDVAIETLAEEMEPRHMLHRYEVDGKRYAVLPGFTKHQIVNNRERASQIPEGPPVREDAPRTRDDATVTKLDAPPTGDDATVTPLAGREGKGKEGKERTSRTRDTKPKPVPLPDGFGVSFRVRRWAREKGIDRLEERLESFVGKAKAKGYTYVDWDEAFMGACREGWATAGGGRNGAGGKSPELPY